MSEEGLDQNSIRCRRSARPARPHQEPTARGLGLLPAGYDDGGFSGATMDRPALQRLLADSWRGESTSWSSIRSTADRSLADFAKIVEILDGRGASFVSVPSSSTRRPSMGRLTSMFVSSPQFDAR